MKEKIENKVEEKSSSKNFKIAIVGTGAVGSACTYALINQRLASDYVLIDINKTRTRGIAHDFQDTCMLMGDTFNQVKNGDYSDLKDTDVVIITAGKAPIPGQNRLEMVSDSVAIIKSIATQIKSSGFKGISIIVSNPVDVITSVYQKLTGFPVNRVFGSGTTLDTSRLVNEIAAGLKVKTSEVKSYIIGEHGDSSIPLWTQTKVKGKPIFDYLLANSISAICLDNFHSDSVNKAYDIVKDKGNTCYGIGASIAFLVKQIVHDTNKEVIISSQINGEYDHRFSGFYISVPTILNREGWVKADKLNIDAEELLKFNDSSQIVLDVLKSTY